MMQNIKIYIVASKLYYDNKMEKCKCLKCGYEWAIRTLNPKQCPRCKRYDWKEKHT